MSKTVAFYSYKGGAGRSTALCNIAYGLAEQGDSVVCIDLDLVAAGLMYVLNVQRATRNKKYIQHYLDDQKPTETLNRYLVDVERENMDYDLDGDLSLVPADPSPEASRNLTNYGISDGEDYRNSLSGMIDELSETEGFDYIFLDCRSGMGAKMPETMGISDDAMVFFRWSKQHREGTKIIANNYLQGVLLNRDATALAIGNSIPERTGEDDIEDFVKKLDPVEEHFSIRESDALKHEERVLLENRSLETDTAEDFDKIVDYVSDNL